MIGLYVSCVPCSITLEEYNSVYTSRIAQTNSDTRQKALASVEARTPSANAVLVNAPAPIALETTWRLSIMVRPSADARAMTPNVLALPETVLVPIAQSQTLKRSRTARQSVDAVETEELARVFREPVLVPAAQSRLETFHYVTSVQTLLLLC
jgi:hypothetical protein